MKFGLNISNTPLSEILSGSNEAYEFFISKGVEFETLELKEAPEHFPKEKMHVIELDSVFDFELMLKFGYDLKHSKYKYPIHGVWNYGR